MLRNYFLINLMLILILGFLGFKLYETLVYRPGMPSPSKVEQAKEKKLTKRVRPLMNEAAYAVITQKDLFRPSRSASEKIADKKDEKAAPKNPPKLFGTIILENEKTAILQDSDSKKTKMYKLNELIAGYTITDIHADKVELVKDGEKFEVKLREDKGIKPTRPKAVQRKSVRKAPEQTQRPVRQRRPRRVRRNVPPPPRTAPEPPTPE